MSKVLHLDTDFQARLQVRRVVEACGHRYLAGKDSSQAFMQTLYHPDVDLVICGAHLDGTGGLDKIKILQAVGSISPEIPIIVFSAAAEILDARLIPKNAIVVEKWDFEALTEAINTLIPPPLRDHSPSR